jgi:SAM-dependent methyltransferase
MFSASAEFYDAIYSFKDYETEAAQIAGLLGRARPGARRVLDVACGTGEHARLLALRHGFAVDGLDLDPNLLRIARSKHPDGRFFESDMSGFDLDARYDAVLSLFSSIGYLVTLQRVVSALASFRRHLAPGGIAIVEPWFPPGVLDPNRTDRLVSSYQGRTVTRVSHSEVFDRLSRLHFDYEVETAEGVAHVSEIHELGLFSIDEMRGAFETAGLQPTYDPIGLSGRGLWIATASAATPPKSHIQIAK